MSNITVKHKNNIKYTLTICLVVAVLFCALYILASIKGGASINMTALGVVFIFGFFIGLIRKLVFWIIILLVIGIIASGLLIGFKGKGSFEENFINNSAQIVANSTNN